MPKEFQGVLDALDNRHATYIFGQQGRVLLDRREFDLMLKPVIISINIESRDK